MDEERRFAELPLIRDLLPAIDNLGRAMDSMGDEPDRRELPGRDRDGQATILAGPGRTSLPSD